MSDRERSRSRSRSPARDEKPAENNGDAEAKRENGGEDAEGIKLYVGNLDYGELFRSASPCFSLSALESPLLLLILRPYPKLTDPRISQYPMNSHRRTPPPLRIRRIRNRHRRLPPHGTRHLPPPRLWLRHPRRSCGCRIGHFENGPKSIGREDDSRE